MEALTPVPTPRFLLTFSQKDVTTFITPYLLNVTYTDKIKGESDELEITLSDAEGRWRDKWYPEKGDLVSLQLGYANERRLDAGQFQIDEVEFGGPPDTVTIRGLASGIKEDTRTKRSVGYESQTLKQIAQAVAARNGYTLVGTVADLHFDRQTQHQQADLGFLKRLAETYGYTFSIKGKTLVFHDLGALDARASVLTVKREHLNSYSLKDKASAVYRGCTVKYHDPKTGRDISHTENASGVVNGDILHIQERCENKAQAIARAKAALRASGGRQTEGSLGLDGDPRLVAGNNVDLTEMGRLNGVYQIRQARHTCDAGGGWVVDNEVQRIARQMGVR